MIETEELKSLLDKAEKKEKVAFKRSLFYSLVPLILAVVLLVFIGWKINQDYQELERLSDDLMAASKNLDDVKMDLMEKEKEVEKYREEIKLIEEQLRQSSNFVKHVHEVSWEDSKMLASLYPRPADLFISILKMRDQGVKWKLGGNSPREGFDSPGFAAYVLADNNLIDYNPSDIRYKLRDVLPRAENPEAGDIIFYDAGFTMFYFKEFCIGMTPVGIVSLDINFGPKIIGYGKINYR